MNKMKKIFFSGWLILILAQIVWAQEKVEVPVWNGGDQWIYTEGMKMEVIRTDENGYVMGFPNQVIILERSTLNRTFTLREKKREAYKESQRRLLDFPLTIGKHWNDSYLAQLKTADVWTYTNKVGEFSLGNNETKMFENYKVLGWEEVEVEAGKFKAIKMEYKIEWTSSPGGLREARAWYWYSPAVKNLVKFQYDKSPIWSKNYNWELSSFHLTR
jgi:hypothetical protein